MSFHPLQILPFTYLSANGRERLAAAMVTAAIPLGETIVRQGDTDDDRVFLLLSGAVEAFDATKGPDRGVNRIEAGHYFAERSALFGIPRAVEIRAATRCELGWISGEDFLAIVRTEPALAHALTFVVRDKHGMFNPIDRFLAEVRLGASRGHLVIGKLLKHYKRLSPALHRSLKGAELDLPALSYAVRRLPSNVSTTFVWFATGELPERYLAASSLFTDTTAVARRRIAFQMMPGKSMVLLRDGMSDLLDMVTCLCIYALEARKLRRRIRNGRTLCDLAGEDAETALRANLSARERTVLEALWPGQVPQRLVEMSLHHEDITIHTYERTNNYNSAHAEAWTRQISDATAEVFGQPPYALPDDLPVHIVSSNTHSVTNCLSPWIPEHADEMLAWGETHAPEVMAAPWSDTADKLVALVRPYLKANPEARADKTAREAKMRVHLEETAFTGIRVQLFRLSDLADLPLDPRLPRPHGDGLIVNIDYAFGQQAEPLIANLVHLFGRRIRSVNILGKAGGLAGSRGDVMVANGFINQREDTLTVPGNHVDVERLAARMPNRTVHTGPILTVLGTILQNDTLLRFYQHLWGCVGLEMEGSYYARQLVECRELGMLRPDVALRFLYYTSDLPLGHGESLASGLGAHEGIPPLYAITREVLASVFETR